MRTSLLCIAVTAILFATSASTAGDKATAPRQLQFRIRMYEGDPLGSADAGTLKLLCDTRLVTLENRPAHLVTGGELPVMRNGQKVEYVQYGRTAELRPATVHDGRVYLEISLENTTVADKAKDRVELHTESTRSLRTIKLGDQVKLRWPGGTPQEQAWIEFSVAAVDPLSH